MSSDYEAAPVELFPVLEFFGEWCGMFNAYAASLAFVIAVAFVLHAWADGKDTTWLDPNFVPCEGMGATASGVIDLHVGYSANSMTLKVTDLQLRTRYWHDHKSAARITYEKMESGPGSLNLEPAWFATIGPDDGSQYLFLPRLGSGSGPTAQKPFEMKSGSSIKVSVTTLFPQFGGNCVASFSDELTLP